MIALDDENLRVAQRCFAALGNVSKALYLYEMIEIQDEYDKVHGKGLLDPNVKARLALLNCDIKAAERIYLDQGDIESALEMYKNFRMWNEAVKLAEKRNYKGLEHLKEERMSYLLSTDQEEQAGEILEEYGDYEKAMNLYLKAEKAAKASRLALKFPQMLDDSHLVSKLTEALVKSELFELAGDIAYKIGRSEAALNLYKRGGAFGRAIELAREVSPDEIINLEEEWGDWLVSKKQLDASINHFIEAGATNKALDSAVGAKQWRKAVQIAKVLDEPDEIKKYAPDLAKHLAFTGDITEAEDLLVRANMYKEAIELLNKHGKWEKAYGVAEKYLNNTEMRDLFVNLATNLEDQGKFRDAEKVLLAVNEPDLAIAMYKRKELYDSMMRLVEKYHKELVDSTHIHLAKQLESRGKFKNAEIHFNSAGDWKSAVHMYCTVNRWEDGFRVAKQKGTEGASSQVAYMWAKSLPIEGAVRLLNKMNLFEVALSFACDSGQFDFAMDLCKVAGKDPDDVHLKMAMALEDEGKFELAEAEFLKANKPKEAILMYTHAGDWKAALNVAENNYPDAVADILIAQANTALDMRNYTEYEILLLRAHRPDIIIDYYKDNSMFDEAIRIAEEHYPSALNDLNRLLNQENARSGKSDNSKSYLQRAAEFAKREEFKKAADCLLLVDGSNSDQATIEKAYLHGAEICNQFLEGKAAVEIAQQLGPKLVKIKQIGPAAQMYLAADMPKEAVDVFIDSEQWAKARRLAKEIDTELMTYVEKRQKSRLKNEGNVDQLADIDIMSALDMLAEQGQWQRCLEKAKTLNAKVVHKYVALYAAQLIREDETVKAMALYLNYGVPAFEQNFNIYNRIALDCFGLREDVGSGIWKDLRNFLFELNVVSVGFFYFIFNIRIYY